MTRFDSRPRRSQRRRSAAVTLERLAGPGQGGGADGGGQVGAARRSVTAPAGRPRGPGTGTAVRRYAVPSPVGLQVPEAERRRRRERERGLAEARPGRPSDVPAEGGEAGREDRLSEDGGDPSLMRTSSHLRAVGSPMTAGASDGRGPSGGAEPGERRARAVRRRLARAVRPRAVRHRGSAIRDRRRPEASSSWASSSPGSSNGPRRRRCGSASRAAARTSAPVTADRPRQAACAIAVRRGDQVAAQPVDAQRRARRGDPQQLSVGQLDARPASARAAAMRLVSSLSGLRRAPRLLTAGSPVVAQPGPHGVGPRARVGAGHDRHAQPEPVQQLRAQLALLRVHRPDEQELAGVPQRDALALDASWCRWRPRRAARRPGGRAAG